MNVDIFALILNPIKDALVQSPMSNAFCIRGKYYTYRDLSHRISAIRLRIRESNSETPLWGLVVNDDLDTYASILALWMEGKGYVPLHPNQPIDRCLNIIEQVGINIVLDSSVQTIYDQQRVISTSLLQYIEDFLDEWKSVSSDALAYILFTSGSTGIPKGVTISRGNVSAFMDSFWKTGINISHEDRCLQCFDLTFDVSVQSFLVALTRGACVYTVPYDKEKFIYVANLIQNERITFGAMAPSMLRYLQPYFEEFDASSIKTTILTAEASPASLIELWHKQAANSVIYDFYGPTEATIYCTYYKVSNGNIKSINGITSIGKPMANVYAIIIDETKTILPVGEKGELCVAGAQVTAGYWNNTQKNQEAFFEKKVNGETLRFYHTGDLCYQDLDGDIMYIGRLDYQVKIQGYRVELGEIEYHTQNFLSGVNAIALPFETKIGMTSIALFIEGTKFNEDDLLGYLRLKMPQYMIPSKLFFIEKFPLNSNEKVDRKQLKTILQNG